MKGKDVFRGMQYLKTEYLEEAEFGTFSREAFYREDSPRRRTGWRRVILVAAAIALAAALVGCGIVYVMKLQDLKLGDRQVTQERWDQEQGTMVYETVSRQVLTFSGLKGTPNYEAAKEWYEFESTYDPDRKIYYEQKEAGTLDWGSAEYTLYHSYTQEMRDKVDEINAKYGLKLRGKRVKAFDTDALYAYLNIDGVLLSDIKASTYDVNASFYDGGWFHTDMHMKLTDSLDWPYLFLCSLYYNPKDCFDITVCELNDTADWQEWNYTTKSGDHLLIIRSPSVWYSWVFCDREDATVTLRIETISEVYSDDSVIRRVMSDDQLKAVLDIIDFSVTPRPGDPALLEGPEASRELTQTRNGYTVAVKDVFTDGLTAKVTLSITGPEDVDLEQYLAGSPEGFLNFSDAVLRPQKEVDALTRGGSHGARSDHDGKANTVEYTLETSYDPKVGIAFPQGGVCSLSLKDLYVNGWNETLSQWEVKWEMEGDWNFELTMDAGDWQEMEFVGTPITTRVSTGWDMEGNDVFEDMTITSLKLRGFGGSYTAPDAQGVLDFADYRNGKYPMVVLKDGSKIKLIGDLSLFDSGAGMIPLDQVDHLELIDGTILTPVN